MHISSSPAHTIQSMFHCTCVQYYLPPCRTENCTVLCKISMCKCLPLKIRSIFICNLQCYICLRGIFYGCQVKHLYLKSFCSREKHMYNNGSDFTAYVRASSVLYRLHVCVCADIIAGAKWLVRKLFLSISILINDENANKQPGNILKVVEQVPKRNSIECGIEWDWMN